MLIYHSDAATSYKYCDTFSLPELKIDFKNEKFRVAQCRHLYFGTSTCVPFALLSHRNTTKVMNMGVIRIPNFDKVYRVRGNEFFKHLFIANVMMATLGHTIKFTLEFNFNGGNSGLCQYFRIKNKNEIRIELKNVIEVKKKLKLSRLEQI